MPSKRGVTRVDFVIDNNTSWDDQLQFGYPDDQSWNFVGASFLLGVNLWTDIYPVTPAPPTTLITFSSAGGTISIVDTINRILAMNVPDTTIQQYMPPMQGNQSCSYVYDLIMVNPNGSRDALCWGKIDVSPGVTP